MNSCDSYQKAQDPSELRPIYQAEYETSADVVTFKSQKWLMSLISPQSQQDRHL